MPRRLSLLGASLLLAACSMTPGGLSQQQLGSSLPVAAEVGPGWSLLGTTAQPPGDTSWDDALMDAARDDAPCHAALTAMDGAATQPAPAKFARSVYRSQGSGSGADRDLSLTVETFDTVPDRAATIRAMTQACSARLRTKAGIRTVTMTVREHRGSPAGTIGYSVEYRTHGLTYSFDHVLARRDRALITATVTGPSQRANQELLRRVVTLAAGNLDRARGAAPT